MAGETKVAHIGSAFQVLRVTSFVYWYRKAIGAFIGQYRSGYGGKIFLRGVHSWHQLPVKFTTVVSFSLKISAISRDLSLLTQKKNP